MKRFFTALIFTLLMVGMAVNAVIAGAPSDWTSPTGMANTMTIHAQVKKTDGTSIDTDGSILAAFKGTVCRGIVAIAQGPAGKWFQLTVASNQNSETNFNTENL